MSLRVWLPLINDYSNYGASGVSVTVNSGAMADGGKLGAKSWHSTGNNGFCVPYTWTGTNQMTIAVWVKPNSASAWSSIFGWGNPSNNDNRVEPHNTNANYYYFGSSNSIMATSNVAFTSVPTTTWSHFAMTADGNKVRYYLNGVKTGEFTQSNTVDTSFGGNYKVYFGGFADYYNGYFNDARIYDHALSQKEIRELAKGMALHLKMDGAGASGVGANIATGAWYEPRNFNLAQYYTALGLNSTDFFGIQVGETVTFSFKSTSPADKRCVARVQFYTDSDHRTSVQGNAIPMGTTGYSSVTWTLTEAQRAYTQMQLLLTNGDTSVTTTYSVPISEVKLERGSARTAWVPSGITYISDVSIGASPVTTSSSSPVQVAGGCPSAPGCIRFTSGQWIQVKDPISSSATEFTISTWIKPSNVSGNKCIWNGRTTFGAAVAIFMINDALRFDDSNLTSYTLPLVANTWYHIACTWKSGGNKIIYVNGVQKSSVTAGTLVKSNTYASIGTSSTGSTPGTYNPFVGDMADFRIYMTQLSADDIKRLYNAPISIANTGVGFASQFDELGSKASFRKTGVALSKGIAECVAKVDRTEPDGSKWMHIVHHNNPGASRFTSTDTFSRWVYKDNDRFFLGQVLDWTDRWELMIVQKATSSATAAKYRWVQTKNPNKAAFADVAVANVTKVTTEGYSTHSSYGGIYKYNTYSYYVANNGTSGNWYGALGCWTLWNNGLPGYAGVAVTTGCIDLYIRVDGGANWKNTFSIMKADNSLVSTGFNEF